MHEVAAAGAALVGVPGTGAHIVAALVASRLGLEHRDVEATLTARGISPADLVLEGDEEYRRVMAPVALDCLAAPRSVVSMGAIALTPQVAAALADRPTVLLTARSSTVAARLGLNVAGGVTLPGLRAEIVRRATAEASALAELADATVTTDDTSPEQVATRVCLALRCEEPSGG